MNNLEYVMQLSSWIALYDREGYRWDTRTWRDGRQVWNKWVEDKLVDSWEPGGRLTREKALELYRKHQIGMRGDLRD